MSIESYLEGYIAIKRGENHWIQNLNLNLYLSQCSIFSNDKESQAQLPNISHLFIEPEILKGNKNLSIKIIYALVS